MPTASGERVSNAPAAGQAVVVWTCGKLVVWYNSGTNSTKLQANDATAAARSSLSPDDHTAHTPPPTTRRVTTTDYKLL